MAGCSLFAPSSGRLLESSETRRAQLWRVWIHATVFCLRVRFLPLSTQRSECRRPREWTWAGSTFSFESTRMGTASVAYFAAAGAICSLSLRSGQDGHIRRDGAHLAPLRETSANHSDAETGAR